MIAGDWSVALAFVLSCLLTSLPAMVGMAVVKHAGISLSGPQGSPLNDDPIYYRWDEGLPGSVVRRIQSAWVELGRRPMTLVDAECGWALVDPGELRQPGGLRDLVVWEIDGDAVDREPPTSAFGRGG